MARAGSGCEVAVGVMGGVPGVAAACGSFGTGGAGSFGAGCAGAFGDTCGGLFRAGGADSFGPAGAEPLDAGGGHSRVSLLGVVFGSGAGSAAVTCTAASAAALGASGGAGVSVVSAALGSIFAAGDIGGEMGISSGGGGGGGTFDGSDAWSAAGCGASTATLSGAFIGLSPGSVVDGCVVSAVCSTAAAAAAFFFFDCLLPILARCAPVEGPQLQARALRPPRHRHVGDTTDTRVPSACAHAGERGVGANVCVRTARVRTVTATSISVTVVVAGRGVAWPVRAGEDGGGRARGARHNGGQRQRHNSRFCRRTAD